jgi:hypothetical protein
MKTSTMFGCSSWASVGSGATAKANVARMNTLFIVFLGFGFMAGSSEQQTHRDGPRPA